MDGLIDRVGRLRRFTRIVLSMGTTTVLTITAWLLIAMILGADAGGSALARLAILFGVGIPLYIYGWSILVGFDRSGSTDWQPDQQAVWYLSAGCLGFVVAVALIVVALVSSDLV